MRFDTLPNLRKQRGVALLIALMVLLVLTLLGLTSSNVSVMQERMSSNAREYNDAFQTAEQTLREIEDRLRSPGTGGLGVIPRWSDDATLASLINDCTLERRFGGNWDSVAWRTAPTTENDYIVIELGDYINPATNLIQASACRPSAPVTRPDGTPVDGQYYLIVARAFGPGEGTRRSQVVAQTIFYWP
jgi:type IV pilus assembly protein PilX